MSGPDEIIAERPHLRLMDGQRICACWTSTCPAAGWAEWSQDQGRTWVRGHWEEDGFCDAGGVIHRSVLAGFQPGLALTYRIHTRPIRSFGPYRVDFGEVDGLLTGVMNPLRDAAGTFSFVMLNDVHGDPEITDHLLSFVRSPVSFAVLNGDWVDFLEDDESIRQGIMEPFARISERLHVPLRFLRGNHETRGAAARRLRSYLLLPGERYYGASTLAGVRMLFLDTGGDKADGHPEYSGLVDFDHYLSVQCEWLRKELDSPAWQQARVRLLFLHLPPRVTLLDGSVFETPLPRHQRLFQLLASSRADLAFAGHLHRAGNDDAGARRPYPLVIGGGGSGELRERRDILQLPTLTHCTVTERRLAVRQIDWNGNTQFHREVSLGEK